MNRRNFLQTGLAGSAILAAATLPRLLAASTPKAPRDPYDGLKMGIASYTFREFTLEQSIAMTVQLGLKYISLKSVHLPLTSTPAQRREARAKVEAAGLTLISCGVIYTKNDENQIRSMFEYARDAGIPTIISSPDIDALDTVEKMAAQYDIRIAIHNHGPKDKNYPSPRDVMRHIKDRNPHMGVCIDVGHTVYAGDDPVEMIHLCERRLYDFHMKDLVAARPGAAEIEVGKGVIDIVGVLKALVKMKYGYHIGLEFSNPPVMPCLFGSLTYMRGVLAAI